MPRYTLELTTKVDVVIVDAKNEEQARRRAIQIVSDDEFDGVPDEELPDWYQHSVYDPECDADFWNVVAVEDIPREG